MWKAIPLAKLNHSSGHLDFWHVVVIGIGATLLGSFALPAANAMPGWMCALYALLPASGYSKLAYFGGLINPLVVWYVFQTFLNETGRTRTYLALAIISCLPPI
jgi:hypothetical protein